MNAYELNPIAPVRYDRDKMKLWYVGDAQLEPRHDLIFQLLIARIESTNSVLTDVQAQRSLRDASYQASHSAYRAIVNDLRQFVIKIGAASLLGITRVAKTGYYLERKTETTPADFPLLLDGMILNSSSELLHGSVDRESGQSCSRLYKSSIEDFAFAIVYGSTLSSLWQPPDLVEKAIDLGGKPVLDQAGALIALLPNDLYKQGLVKKRFLYGQILDEDPARDRIGGYLNSLARSFAIPEVLELCKEWLVREAQRYMGDDKKLFDPKADPTKLYFGKEYYNSPFINEIPKILGERSIKGLEDLLPPSPHGKNKDAGRYTRLAKREFVLRNLLTHFTGMHEYEQMARSACAFHVSTNLRGWIKRRFYASHSILKDDVLRRLLVRSALFHAFREVEDANDRSALVSALTWMRKWDDVRWIRDKIEEYCALRRFRGKRYTQDAENILTDLKRELNKSPGRVEEIGIDRVAVAGPGSHLQVAGVEAAEYLKRFYEFFPELKLRR